MEICFRCDKSEKEVRLVDAIYENDMVKICERCAVLESIPIIRKPSTSQLKEAERSYTVYQRLRKLAGEEQEEKHETVLEQIKRLEENPELEKPEEKRPFNLIDNFHWHAQRARRNKGLSQKQLAWAIGESETAIKMIEKEELPEDAEKLIRKLEQFFQIKLRERTEEETEEERMREAGKEEFKIPKVEVELEEEAAEEAAGELIEPIEPIITEPELDEMDIITTGDTTTEGITKESEIGEIEAEIEEKPGPAKVLSFKPEVMKGLTIADLKEIKEEKEREGRLSAVEEESKKALQADILVQEIKDEEKRKQELKERIANEMKDIALGKEKPESVGEKKEMLDKAVKKLDKEEGKEHVPTISELVEKRKKEEGESMVGDEIELTEEIGIANEVEIAEKVEIADEVELADESDSGKV